LIEVLTDPAGNLLKIPKCLVDHGFNLALPGSGYHLDMEVAENYILLFPDDSNINWNDNFYSLNTKTLFHN